MPSQLAVPTRPAATNQPPIYVDGTTALGYLDSGTQLLTAGSTKVFRVRATALEQARSSADPVVVTGGTPPVSYGVAPALATAGGKSTVYKQRVASGVKITNRSGQDAEITLTMASDSLGTQLKSEAPIYLPDGGTLEVGGRIWSVTEKNLGSGTQTGHGVCYLFAIDPFLG